MDYPHNIHMLIMNEWCFSSNAFCVLNIQYCKQHKTLHVCTLHLTFKNIQKNVTITQRNVSETFFTVTAVL